MDDKLLSSNLLERIQADGMDGVVITEGPV